MGREVETTRFERHDFLCFEARLRAETDLLHAFVERDALSQHAPVAGLELEAWLIDAAGRPAPRNDEVIARMDSANSPLLLGRQLWQESRIALFEQALNIGAREDGRHAPLVRVGFGSGYAGYSLVECFRENAERFGALLPVAIDDQAPEKLPHLRLHNGTIWRWNRPLVGFDAEDGRMHLRVEHRPMAAGPSMADMMANLAFAIGLVVALARDPVAPESRLPLAAAESNFYAAARRGMVAPLHWLDGRDARAGDLLASLVGRARAGLGALGVDAAAAARWMALIQERLAARMTGARRQLERLAALGGDLLAPTLDHARRQRSGEPVHCWF